MNDQLLDTEIKETISLSSSDINSLVKYAVNLFTVEELSKTSVIKRIISLGHTEETGFKVTEMAMVLVNEVNRKKAMKNVIIGGIFLVLGTVLTLAQIGFIFYGAIIFGGIQFVKGLIDLNNKAE